MCNKETRHGDKAGIEFATLFDKYGAGKQKGQQALPYNARVSHAAETPQNKSQYER